MVLPRVLGLAYMAAVARAQGSSASASASASASETASATASASACATLSPKNPAPSVASGWRASVVANGLTEPRVMVFDDEGGLLVSESSRGISRIVFEEGDGEGEGGCVGVGKAELIIDDEEVSRFVLFLVFYFWGDGWGGCGGKDGFGWTQRGFEYEKRYDGFE